MESTPAHSCDCLPGRPFIASLEGNVYCCNICAAHLAIQGDLLSKVRLRVSSLCCSSAALMLGHSSMPGVCCRASTPGLGRRSYSTPCQTALRAGLKSAS